MATDIFSGNLADFERQINAMANGPDKDAALAAIGSAYSSASVNGSSILNAINGTPSPAPSPSSSASSDSGGIISTLLQYSGRAVMVVLGVVVIAGGLFLLKGYSTGEK
jgi:hypothetical protein